MPMLVDTGADISFIDSRVIDMEGKSITSSKEALHGIGGDSSILGYITTDIIINNTSFTITFAVKEFNDFEKIFPTSPKNTPKGVIGGSFLKMCNIVIDYGKKEIYIIE